MTVKFSSSMVTLFTYQTWSKLGGGGAIATTVYTGAIPTSSTIINNWQNYNQNSTLCLWHGTGVTLQILGNDIINAQGLPVDTAPFRNGTASWFILWTANYASVNVPTIPNTEFMIGDCSTLFETGVMKFIDINLNSLTPTTISELNFKYTYTG